MLLSLFCSLGTLAGLAETSREYQIKAVFLFNFAQFTTWPREAFATNKSPLVIGILGTDPFGAFLDDTVRGETVNGRPLVVERYRTVAEIKSCHILYIGQSEADRLGTVLEALKGRPTLTVSDVPDPARRGVMIRLVTDRRRIRLRINLEAVKGANLTLSSKLLQASEIVGAERS